MGLKTPADRIEMLDVVGVLGQTCVEVGVFQGEYSEQILKKNVEALYLVDPWTHQGSSVYPDDHANLASAEFDKTYHDVVEKFKTDSRVRFLRAYSYFAAKHFEDDSLGFVYIDAIHTFESCLCDALAWYHKVRPGGWLCGHDYTGKFTGVKLAVDAFCKISGESLALVTLEPWASWGVRKKLAP